MILLDTSGLFSALVRNQRAHAAARAVLEAADGPFVLSPFVLADASIVVLADRLSVARVLVPGLLGLNVDHATGVRGHPRLLAAPAEHGLADRVLSDAELNPHPHPFP